MSQDRPNPSDDDPTAVFRPGGGSGSAPDPTQPPASDPVSLGKSSPPSYDPGPSAQDPYPYPPGGYGQQPSYGPQPGYDQQQYAQYPPPYDPQTGYPQQPYPTAYPPAPYAAYAAYPVAAPTNTMAILSLIFAFVFSPLGIVFGFIGRSQIKRTGESGDGLALAGIIVGGIFTFIFVAYIVVVIVALAALAGSAATY